MNFISLKNVVYAHFCRAISSLSSLLLPYSVYACARENLTRRSRSKNICLLKVTITSEVIYDYFVSVINFLFVEGMGTLEDTGLSQTPSPHPLTLKTKWRAVYFIEMLKMDKHLGTGWGNNSVVKL